MGVQARLINKFLRKLTSALNNKGVDIIVKPTIVLINQIRHKIGGYGDPTTTPGGMGQDFAISVDIRTLKPTYAKIAGEEIPPFIDCNFNIRKNKVGINKMEGTFRFFLRDYKGFYKGQTDEIKQVFDYATKANLIDLSDKKVVKCLGEEFKTQKALKVHMYDYPEFLLKLRTLTMSRLLGITDE